jgi:hypothetical protein
MHELSRVPGWALVASVAGPAWLVVQNSLLILSDPRHADPAPVVVARGLARVVILVAGRYPLTAALLIVTAGLALYLGIAAWKDASPKPLPLPKNDGESRS